MMERSGWAADPAGRYPTKQEWFDMTARRPLVEPTRAASRPAAAAAKGDLIAVLWRQLRDVRAGTGIEGKLQLSARVPATVAPGAVDRLSRAVDAARADTKPR